MNDTITTVFTDLKSADLYIRETLSGLGGMYKTEDGYVVTYPTGMTGQRSLPPKDTPQAAYEQFMQEYIRLLDSAKSPQTPPAMVDKIALSPIPTVREFAAKSPNLPPSTRDRLQKDPVKSVREAAGA